MSSLYDKVKSEVSKVIVGKERELKTIIASLIAGGHVILEGVPGVAKTTMARAIAKSIGLSFSRIQFTPDMLPSDVLGTFIYSQKDSKFKFRRGPIFANIVLADEINRASPRTQSAFLEAMQEHQVTVWGRTFRLPEPFLVLATMNPVEMEGVYPLPEAQRDRFMARVVLGYPSPEELVEIMDRFKDISRFEVNAVATAEEVLEAQKRVWDVRVDSNIKTYIVKIVEESRRHPHVQLGGSPRAALSILMLSRGLAVAEGLDYVHPDHVKEAARAALPHRLVLTPEARLEGVNQDRVTRDILDSVEPP
ncbi:MAG: MoxR family ATPase [Aeropyrum sp.]|nr:MoxR family ATPase [Aeropyrum sp.]